MTTKADLERELVKYAETTAGLTSHKSRKFYFGYTWAYEKPCILTKKFIKKLIASYEQKFGEPATELLIKSEDMEDWMKKLDIQIIPGIVPTKCFYLGVL